MAKGGMVELDGMVKKLRAAMAKAPRRHRPAVSDLVRVWATYHAPRLFRAYGVPAADPRVITMKDARILRALERAFDRAGVGLRSVPKWRASAIGSRVAMTRTLVVILLLLSPISAEAARPITAAELGDRWPLTVREGELDCIRGPEVPGIRRVDVAVFRASGKTYALNGAARNRGYLPPEPIWRQDPAMPQLRISISPLIELALKECR